MNRFGFGLALVLCLSPLCFARIAHAQSAENKAAAEAMFAEGRRLMDQGKYAEACKKLEGSQRLDPGAGTLLNLSACYEANGQTASAWATYKEAAVAAQARHPDWAQQATSKIAALEPRLSTLTILVDKPVDGLLVTRDGVKVEATTYGIAVPVDPGPHAIEASATGFRTARVEVTIGASKDANSITLPALVPGESSKPGGGGSGSGMRIAGIAAIGVGVVGLVAASVAGVVALGKKNDASLSCGPDFKVCSTGGKALVDDAKATGVVSTIGFIAGGVLVAAGVTLILVAPKGEKKVEASLGAPGAQLGLTLGGTF